MKYGYARVSTLNQDLQSQIEQLEKEGCLEENIFKDKFTGTKRDRPNFNILLDILQEGDTLVVTKLDRFARSSLDGINIIKDLFERGVKVHVLNMGIVEDTPTGRLIFNIMMAFAEFERDMIVERTQEGKAIAKQRDDFREGRPKKFTKQQTDHALQLLENYTYKEVEAMTGISKSTLIRAKRKRETMLMNFEKFKDTFEEQLHLERVYDIKDYSLGQIIPIPTGINLTIDDNTKGYLIERPGNIKYEVFLIRKKLGKHILWAFKRTGEYIGNEKFTSINETLNWLNQTYISDSEYKLSKKE